MENQAQPGKLPEDVQATIEAEAKRYAFSNYVSGNDKGAVFDDIDTWPHSAQVSYYSILYYVQGSETSCPWATRWAQKWWEERNLNEYFRIKNRHLNEEVGELKKENERLKAALEEITTVKGMPFEVGFRALEIAREIARKALAENGKEAPPARNVSIGEWITYCEACGFPVDECNCESLTHQNDK